MVVFPHRNKHEQPRTTFPAMKTTNDTSLLEKLNVIAAVSCVCSVFYFLASNLLA